MAGMLQAFKSCSSSHCIPGGREIGIHSAIDRVEFLTFKPNAPVEALYGSSPSVVYGAVGETHSHHRVTNAALLAGGKGRKKKSPGRKGMSGRASFGVTDKLGNKEQRAVKTVRIHYNRRDKDYDPWGLHVWGDAKYCTPWDSPLAPGGIDDFGCYWDVEVTEGGKLYFLIHTGRQKEFEGIMDTGKDGSLWVVSDYRDVFTEKPDLASIPRGDLGLARALWVREDLIATASSGDSFVLHGCKEAKLTVTAKGVEGGSVRIQLEEDIQGLPVKVVEKFPHISGYKALRVPRGTDIKELVKCQLALSSRDAMQLLVFRLTPQEYNYPEFWMLYTLMTAH